MVALCRSVSPGYTAPEPKRGAETRRDKAADEAVKLGF